MWIYLTNVIGHLSSQLSHLSSRFHKFKKLVNGYRQQGHSFVSSVFYASRLVYRRNQLDHYSQISSVREGGVVFVKTIIGGTPQLITFRVRSGPKPVLDYAYFDGERKDNLFLLLSGPNRDFNSYPAVLFMFAKEIRYKFINQPEVTMKTDSTHHSATHLEKKILSMCSSYD